MKRTLEMAGKVKKITNKSKVKKFNFIECCECSELHNSNKMHETVNGDLICESCKENYYTECEDCNELHYCGNYAHDSVLYSVNNWNYVCESCYQNYTECYECGGDVLESDAYERNGRFYCENCYNDSNDTILNYDDSPEYIYYGNNQNKLGIELEVDGGGEKEECAESIINLSDEVIFCKEDGSLNDGFEAVTHPCDFEYHMQNIDYKKILEEIKNHGFKSHDTETCGMHIHITRSQFTDYQIANMVFFIEKNWVEILTFSRRKEENLRKWSDRYYIDKFTNINIDEISGGSRYYAVNLTNEETVELRFFRGTLKYETFMANVQFAHALTQFVKNYESYEMNWDIFVDYLYTVNYQVNFLIDYINLRSLNTTTTKTA